MRNLSIPSVSLLERPIRLSVNLSDALGTIRAMAFGSRGSTLVQVHVQTTGEYDLASSELIAEILRKLY